MQKCTKCLQTNTHTNTTHIYNIGQAPNKATQETRQGLSEAGWSSPLGGTSILQQLPLCLSSCLYKWSTPRVVETRKEIRPPLRGLAVGTWPPEATDGGIPVRAARRGRTRPLRFLQLAFLHQSLVELTQLLQEAVIGANFPLLPDGAHGGLDIHVLPEHQVSDDQRR